MGKPDLGNRVWIITPGHLNFKKKHLDDLFLFSHQHLLLVKGLN